MKLLTLRNEKLVVIDTQARGIDGAEVVATVTSVEQFNAITDANGGAIMCSSSVDFPREYTNDETVIELCRSIRS